MARRLGFLAATLAVLTVACGGTGGTTTTKDGGSAGNSATGGTGGTATTKDGGSAGNFTTGGAGSGTRIDVTVDPPTLTEAFRAAGQSVTPPKLKIDLSLSQPITQSVYLKITEDQPILLASAPVDQPQPNNKGGYEAWLNLDPELAVGTYQGTLRFEICKDVSCQSLYNLSGNEIPYLVEVHPAVTITIAKDELPPGSPLTERAVLGPVRTGTTVRVEASEQVVYSQSSDGVRVDSVMQDGTSWKGTLLNERDAGSGSFGLKLISVELPLAQVDCDFMVTN